MKLFLGNEEFEVKELDGAKVLKRLLGITDEPLFFKTLDIAFLENVTGLVITEDKLNMAYQSSMLKYLENTVGGYNQMRFTASEILRVNQGEKLLDAVQTLNAINSGVKIEMPVEQQAELTMAATNGLAVAEAGEEWQAGVKVSTGQTVTYDNKQYKCLQPHITQADWTPDKTPALWVVMQKEPEQGEILLWMAGTAVKSGDKRIYNNKTYECIQPHTTQNGWEPPNVAALWKLIN